jgi:hypothetical protein
MRRKFGEEKCDAGTMVSMPGGVSHLNGLRGLIAAFSVVGGSGSSMTTSKPKLMQPFRFEIGPYWILLPGSANITANVRKPRPETCQVAWTHWAVSLGRFDLFIHLDALNDLTELKSFIDYSTKSDVITPSISVNGVSGVTHGDYGPPRTWIDWWLKKGDTMICLCLQSKTFPIQQPNEIELAEHKAIINSIKYC